MHDTEFPTRTGPGDILRTITDLRPGHHICCLYETAEEHRLVLTPFLRQGLEQGQKVLYIVDAHTAETILGYLREDGLDVQPYLARGQLTISTHDETYMRDGVFDPERMIDLLSSETARALAEGYRALRVTGEMTWTLRGLPGSERLIEYEARLNDFFPGSSCLAICQYDRRRFDPAVLLDVLRTHPIAVVGTEVFQNFYYIPPSDLLHDAHAAAELRRWVHNLAERKRVEERQERLLAEIAQDRQVVERLARSVERERQTLLTIMENTQAHLAYLDPQFNFVRVNSAYARGAGYSKEELVGHNHFDLFPHAENEAIFKRVRKTGEPAVFHAKAFEYPDRPELGTTYWDWILVPVKDANGELQGLVFSLLDVTERERARERMRHHADELERRVAERTAALRASEAQFRALFEEAAIGIALVDTQGRFVETNPALQSILGYGGEELRGMVYTELAHPDDVPAMLTLHQQLIAGERDQYCTQNRLRRKDGRWAWASLIVSLVRGAGGQPQFAISMVEDITEQKHTQAALLQAEKLAIAGRLATSLAHEINNPLQSVIGCLGLAKKTLAAGGDVERYVQVAHEELRRAARIVAQLRDLQRRSEPEEREPADVNALLERVLVVSRKQCQDRGVEVVWRGANDLPPLLLVPDRMQQVFLNLVLNALDALPRGGQLRISTARIEQPNGVRIKFTDDGVGIAPDILPRIFDPFYSTKPDGLGLGLFISQDIVNQHGGYIEAQSQAGKGTTFTVWLPA